MIDQMNDAYLIKCHFCGKINNFTTKEISEGTNDNPIFKEKFCVECGAPLLLKCPRCNTVFRLDQNFQHHHSKEVLPTFWEPKSDLKDALIPELQNIMQNYDEFVTKLSLNDFRANQKQFLDNLEELTGYLENIKNFFKKSSQKFFSPNDNKLDAKILKILSEIEAEIMDIHNHIDPQNHLVDLKKEKQLKKKGFNFDEIIPLLNKLINRNKGAREEEIANELEQLKPGLKKYKDHFKVPSHFFQLICPTCQIHMYCIQESIYVFNSTDHLEIVKKIPFTIKESSDDLENSTNLVKFTVKINLFTQQSYDFHGSFSLPLFKNEPFTFGRDFIREIDYDGKLAEEILFNEADPLARVSNSQVTLQNTDKGVFIIPMKYDERRVGLYYNSISHDLRIENPEGILLTPKDNIIIPLISKDNIRNQIILQYQGIN